MNNKQIIFNSIGDGHVDLSTEFVALFPKLTQLLEEASKVEFTLNGNQRFRQYIWTNPEGKTSGWLCKLEHCIPQGRHLIEEHILLAKTMGGIINCWLSDDIKDFVSLIDANKYTFSLTDSHVGIGGWEDDYRNEVHKDQPLDVSKFVTFSLEVNGNTTCYNSETKEVFAYLHDDYSPFKNTPLDEQSLCALYRYDDAKTFIDYVELLADQWLTALKN